MAQLPYARYYPLKAATPSKPIGEADENPPPQSQVSSNDRLSKVVQNEEKKSKKRKRASAEPVNRLRDGASSLAIEDNGAQEVDVASEKPKRRNKVKKTKPAVEPVENAEDSDEQKRLEKYANIFAKYGKAAKAPQPAPEADAVAMDDGAPHNEPEVKHGMLRILLWRAAH
jgi:hypothetical protein